MFDIRTIIVIILSIHIAGSIIIILTWLRLKDKFKGLHFIIADHLLRTIGFGLLALRGIIPDFFSIIVANVFVISGISFLLIGVEQIFNKKLSTAVEIFLISILVIILSYFTYIYPSFTGRTAAIYGVNALQCFQLYWLLAHKVSRRHRTITFPVAIVFMLFALASTVRVVIALCEKTEGKFFSIHSIGTSFTLVYSVLCFLVLISVLLLLIFLLYDEILQNQHNLKELVKRRTEQLVQAEKLATLGTLSAGIAHEINNPNNFILMNAEILAKGQSALQALLPLSGDSTAVRVGNMSCSDFVKRMPQIVNDIHDGAKRIERIVGDLKDYACPSIKDDVVFDLNDAVNTAAYLNKATLGKSTRNFSIQLCSGRAMIRGDKQKVVQAITNLLQNAAQSLTSEAQSVIICTGINREKHRVFVEVIDEGRGIPREIVHQITDPFFTTRRAEGGTGLGLWTVYHIVREHKGELQFDSQPGHGTTVHVEFAFEEIV